MAIKVAVLVGSFRKDSINQQLAKALGKLGAGKFDFQILKIEELPFYNQDIDSGNPPAAAVKFRQDVAAADAVLIVTPEYNRSVPGVLANAIEWGSRPYGQGPILGKTGALIGASIGKIGTAVAQAHLRGAFGFLDMKVMGQPEAYITVTPGLFDANNDVTDASVKDFLSGFLAKFEAWVAKNK
ncbi:NADPH-dependent FMN reductase [Lacibacterium aquatile]|uniref:NADPH-dependent FMN reductase n=1 Tax=Lacibacterium aquatile TaxID=1168082 RepID=A0ABW5DM36_9PROT